jgi:hypothetical protein
MGRMKDPIALERYRRVLINLGHVRDYIQWKRGALERVSRHLPNVAAELVHQLMIEHARAGGKIDQVEETREDYVAWKFHYDLRLPISGQRIYIETVFDDREDDDDCVIYVVNIHPA